MFEVTIAIPARNEVELIGRALAAAAVAAEGMSAAIVVLANDCTDGTQDEVRRFARRGTIPVVLAECRVPPGHWGAGHARRLAMDMARHRTAPDGLVVSTDADSELDRGSLAAFRNGAAAGADLVCGTISTHLPDGVADAPSICRIDRVSEAYGACVLELRHAVDVLYGRQAMAPRPHYIESGACLAVTRAAYDRIGGLPCVGAGEDRALARRVERYGGHVHYCTVASAKVSGRVEGRASGGMADTIRQRLATHDPEGDAALLSPAELHEVWREAVFRLPGGRRPPVRETRRPLRAGELERALPEVQAFLAEVVRPELVIRLETAQCSRVA